MYDKLLSEAHGLLGVMQADLMYEGCFECRKDEYDTIKALVDALEEAEKQIPRWIPMTEAKPTQNKEYLVTDPEDEDLCTADWRKDHWLDSDTITHWMPLPKGEEEEK